MKTIFLLSCSLSLCCIGLTGCVTKSAAEAKARDAYLAGQREAYTRMQQQPPGMQGAQPAQSQQSAQPQQSTVSIDGPVANPTVPWTPGLTLSQALITANYTADAAPIDILIVRNRVATRVDVSKLLSGQDTPLQAGDVVHLVIPPANLQSTAPQQQPQTTPPQQQPQVPPQPQPQNQPNQ
jgi:hypothetical protein